MRTHPIALVHGLGSSFEHGWRATGWTDLIADAGRAVVPVDVLGHGNAAAPRDPAAYARLSETVEAALPGEPVDAIGFSLGAHLLLRIAARRPDRFGRLVVIGAGENVFRHDDLTGLADAFDHGNAPEDLTGRLFVEMARGAGNDLQALAACVRRPLEPFSPDDAARVAVPVLVIIGDRDFAGPAEPLVDALPDAQCVVLKGVDHFRAPSEFGCMAAALDFVEASI
jgi:pimeloyl-ACP methyl ester carboxylesterase